MTTLHVAPSGDLIEHNADDDCARGPVAQPITDNGAVHWLPVHHGHERHEPEATTPGG